MARVTIPCCKELPVYTELVGRVSSVLILPQPPPDLSRGASQEEGVGQGVVEGRDPYAARVTPIRACSIRSVRPHSASDGAVLGWALTARHGTGRFDLHLHWCTTGPARRARPGPPTAAAAVVASTFLSPACPLIKSSKSPSLPHNYSHLHDETTSSLQTLRPPEHIYALATTSW